jgi:hypothetical protein
MTFMFCVTGTTRHDSVVFEELVDSQPAIGGVKGSPLRWPEKLHAGKGYDFACCHEHLKQRGVKSRITRKGIERNDQLGCHR